MIWDTPGGRYMLFGDQLVRLTGRHEEVVARAISCDGASAELRGSGQVVFVPPTVPGLSVVSKVETLVPTVTRADSDLVTMGENDLQDFLRAPQGEGGDEDFAAAFGDALD